MALTFELKGQSHTDLVLDLFKDSLPLPLPLIHITSVQTECNMGYYTEKISLMLKQMDI